MDQSIWLLPKNKIKKKEKKSERTRELININKATNLWEINIQQNNHVQ
jgi:hypothetical protein